jgi:hypothetical protein
VPSPARNLSTSVVAGAGTNPEAPAADEVAPVITVIPSSLVLSVADINPFVDVVATVLNAFAIPSVTTVKLVYVLNVSPEAIAVFTLYGIPPHIIYYPSV